MALGGMTHDSTTSALFHTFSGTRSILFRAAGALAVLVDEYRRRTHWDQCGIYVENRSRMTDPKPWVGYIVWIMLAKVIASCRFCIWKGDPQDLWNHVQEVHPKEWDKAHRETVHELKGLFPSIE